MPPKKPKGSCGYKHDGGRMSKKEQASIRHEAAKPIQYCWIDWCYHFQPCPKHFDDPGFGPWRLVDFLDLEVQYLEAFDRGHLVPCLLPIFRALYDELMEAAALEIKERGKISQKTQQMINTTKGNIAKYTKQASAESLKEPPTRPQFDGQRALAVMEHRIARMHAKIHKEYSLITQIAEFCNTGGRTIMETFELSASAELKQHANKCHQHRMACEECRADRYCPIDEEMRRIGQTMDFSLPDDFDVDEFKKKTKTRIKF